MFVSRFHLTNGAKNYQICHGVTFPAAVETLFAMDGRKQPTFTIIPRTTDKDDKGSTQEERLTLLHRETSSFSQGADSSLPPPPPPPPRRRSAKISSLDFERVVNDYSIQATRDRFLLTSIPEEEEEFWSERSNDPTRHAHGDVDGITEHAHQQSRKQKITTGRTATRWALSAIVGLFTGLATTVLVEVTSLIINWRIEALDVLAQNYRTRNGRVFVDFLLLNLVMAVAASALCVFVAPEGTGSGIVSTNPR